MTSRPAVSPDRGIVLPIVLVVAVVFSLIIVALASFVAADLRFARVAVDSAERQATATSAIDYGVERIRLGQTLCAAPVAEFGPLAPSVLDLNDTTTTLECARLGSGPSSITGWSVIITGEGITSNLFEVLSGGTTTIEGQAYIDDVDEISIQSGSQLDHVDGDLWYRRATCPGAAVSLPGNHGFVPTDARGTFCTDNRWDEIITDPVVPDLTTLPVNDGSVYVMDGACRVFLPARYTGQPALGTDDAYFRSGTYHLDGIGRWIVQGQSTDPQSVWFGHPGALSGAEQVANTACEHARDSDPNAGGTGAVIYLDGDTGVRTDQWGEVEFFPRDTGGVQLSVQQLPTSTNTADASPVDELVMPRVSGGNRTTMVVHGLVHAPAGWVRFNNTQPASIQQLLGGAVVARLTVESSGPGHRIAAATAPQQAEVLLTATSTTDGNDTAARAVVHYRPGESDPAARVAVSSVRIVDQ